jgi:CRP-like cAMP-binding protein
VEGRGAIAVTGGLVCDAKLKSAPQDNWVLAKKLGTYVHLHKQELACLAEIQSAPTRIARGKQLVHEGQSDHDAYILHSGWACAFKLMPDGGRQIIWFPIAGDCIGLLSVLLHTADHSISALTDVVVSRVAVSRLATILTEFPRLGAAVLWATSRDEAMLVERLVSLGRRSAIERTAHFFLELYERLRLVGLATDTEFMCPLNQYLLADALGLSAIHVNRVLRQLREQNLLTIRGREVIIQNKTALKALAG